MPALAPVGNAEVSPSPYQQRILDFIAHGKGNGVVRATAGAGKTTTLVQVAESLPGGLRICFLAFARDAAAELARRLPRSVVTMTVHKLGRLTLARFLRSHGTVLQDVDRNKYRRLLRHDLEARLDKLHPPPPQTLLACEEYLLELTQLCRLGRIDASYEGEVTSLARRFGLALPASGSLLATVHRSLASVLERGESEALADGVIDFTDMLYLPVQLALPPPRFDFVCVDEAQDYSPLALDFTLRLVAAERGGRLLFVGDPRQSIFGFAGAHSEALDRIARDSDSTVLPLSVTYRCPRSHVELARLLAPEIEVRPDAPKGRVYWIADAVLEQWAREGDLLLCRANAPLVRTGLRLVRSGKAAFLLGHELASTLAAVVKGATATGRGSLLRRLLTFRRAEQRRLRRLLVGQPHAFAVMAKRLDLLDCLIELGRDLPGREARQQEVLLARIEALFGQRSDAVTLATVHRAKGMEADRVLLLYPELMPAPYARTEQASKGEECVQFVALTRSRNELVFVSKSGCSRSHRKRDTSNETLAAGSEEVGQGMGRWRAVLTMAQEMAMQRAP